MMLFVPENHSGVTAQWIAVDSAKTHRFCL